MNISVFGTGYVGLVAGACLADVGHQVICMDINAERIARLEAGEVPIYEPGLTELVTQNVAAGRLHFTADTAKAVKESELIFIAVGTPPDEDGSADLRHVLTVVTVNLSLIKIAKRKVKSSLLALLSRSDKSSPN